MHIVLAMLMVTITVSFHEAAERERLGNVPSLSSSLHSKVEQFSRTDMKFADAQIQWESFISQSVLKTAMLKQDTYHEVSSQYRDDFQYAQSLPYLTIVKLRRMGRSHKHGHQLQEQHRRYQLVG